MNFVWEIISQAFELIAAGDAQLADVVVRTLLLATLATASALIIGLPAGVWIAERSTRLRRLAVTFANAGLGLPPVVLGVFLALLLLPGAALGGLEWTNTIQGVWLAQVLLALPIVIALTASAVATVPEGLVDQARAFGARWPARMMLTLREARIGVIAATITAFGSALSEVGAVVIVGGNLTGKTTTLASGVLLDLSAGNAAAATAHVIVLLVLVALLSLTLTVVQQRGARPPADGAAK